jgi:hypothetical protein
MAACLFGVPGDAVLVDFGRRGRGALCVTWRPGGDAEASGCRSRMNTSKAARCEVSQETFHPA